MNEPCPLRDSILSCEGHALVTGGPGSGKTTIALRKAVKRIQQGMTPGQSALFLSFSRAAVARILDAAKLEATAAEQEQLSIQTFHSFFWDILKAHAYLLGAPRKLSILLPQDEKALSGGIDNKDDEWDQWLIERERLFREEGRIAFDLFAPKATCLLTTSIHLLSSLARRHPIIIVDEAQDTGQSAWQCVEMLAQHTQIVCLADLEQQIFDYLPDVGPERIAAIRAALHPLEVDLGTQNHRSPDSEILIFANDILDGQARGAPYKGISSFSYQPEKPTPNWNHVLRCAIAQLLSKIRAESDNRRPQTLAILVSNNRSALRMSKALNAIKPNVGKAVPHKLLFDEAGALLSARFAAFLLEPKDLAQLELDVAASMELIAAARRATGQAKTAVGKLLRQAGKIRGGKTRNINIVKALRGLIAGLHADGFTGNPVTDWHTVKDALRATGQNELLRVANQLDFLVAFQRGHRISAGLANEWLHDGAYTNARLTLDQALAQEHILDDIETPRLQVMNFHKAKGKQFDGVVIVREARRTAAGVQSSFVWRGDKAPHLKSRKVLRVGITRARIHTLIVNPMWPPCPILRGHKL